MKPNTVTVRDLRNDSRAILQRVRNGESFELTLDGEPVAELCPIERPGTPVSTLLREWRGLPVVDYAELRADIDAVLDPRLFPE
jgi:antitoxin (DNA-binding transcriptional repressor) of toxin-antitoxin stability system